MTSDRVVTRTQWLSIAGVLALYLVLAFFYTRPLIEQSFTRIANDPYDPILNTSVLWWNATTVPFSERWWSPPHYYPSENVAAFTEGLTGVSLFASPVIWLTGNPLAAYNLAFFLTWPLSAFGTYLLVLFLSRRHDAALLAGLAFGFAPYRTAQMAHIQVLSSYWLPIILLGLHGFLEQRRLRWLIVFGSSWLVQSLANGYFMLFGGVLIALWIAYFCSSRDTWRAAPAIIVAWILASLPLVPILLKYRAIHDHYGLSRDLPAIIAFSAQPLSWIQASGVLWFWHRFLPEADSEVNLFPGLTIVAIVLVAASLSFRIEREAAQASRARRTVRRLLTVAAAATVLISIVFLAVGPFNIAFAGLTVRMSDLNRALAVATISIVALLLMTSSIRHALSRRSALAFYAAATLVIAVLSCGPQLRDGSFVLLDPAPYGWLLALPGFADLRVPARFWMLGALCLATAAGLAFAQLTPIRRRAHGAIVALVAAGILLEGWIRGMGMAIPPQHWPKVERRDASNPILELPFGPSWDAAATFRAVRHRRRVVNGVSGYDPPHYAPLRIGLEGRDPSTLLALASLGPLDVIVNGQEDADGALDRYVSDVPGVERIGSDGIRTAFRIPRVAAPDISLGDKLPIVAMTANANDGSLHFVTDGDFSTGWQDGPQQPGQWVTVDLGAVRTVGGLVHAVGRVVQHFPRRLAIELSSDGSSWNRVWEGDAAAPAFLAAVRAPREVAMRFEFSPQAARFVRLQQLAHDEHYWTIIELGVFGGVKK
jgi:F5/8 type C domain